MDILLKKARGSGLVRLAFITYNNKYIYKMVIYLATLVRMKEKFF